MIGAVAIAGGYVALVWQFGWWGLAAAAMHLLLMGAAIRR